MGLIKCIDCGKEFSDRVEACPNCACPTKEIIKELSSENKEKVELSKLLFNGIKKINIDADKYKKEEKYRIKIYKDIFANLNKIEDNLKELNYKKSDSLKKKQEKIYNECMKSDDNVLLIDYLYNSYYAIIEFIEEFDEEVNDKCLVEIINKIKNLIESVANFSEEDLEVEKKYKPYIVDKKKLMNSNEMKRFAFNSIVPFIEKELEEKIIKIKETKFENDDVDFYIDTHSKKIGIKVFIEIAPNKVGYHYIDNLVKKCQEKGYLFATASIGVGARDEVFFNRRIVLNEAEYMFDYQQLKFHEIYSDEDKSEIKYSLSRVPETYDYILKNIPDYVSPLAVQKPEVKYNNKYYGDSYQKELREVFYKNKYPVEDFQFYYKFIFNLAIAINHKLDIERLFLTFINCVEFCKGNLYSDSVPVLHHEIMPVVVEELEKNSFVDLSKYEKYNFAFYVYHFIISKETDGDILSPEKMNEIKINVFNNFPKHFGFYSLAEKREKERQINSYENIYKMLEDGIDFVNNNFQQFTNINLMINNSGVKTPINFADVNEKINELLKDARNKMKFLQNGFDITQEFSKKEIYTMYRKALNSYIDLLELDHNMNHKLCNKSKGGRYGFFEYRKDSKIRNQKCNETVQLIEMLSNIFTIKKLSKNSYLMIDACKHLVIDLKDKYYNEIKDNKKLYKSFREELCNFHDYVLTMPFDKDAEDFRRGVLFTIENFIELIEFNEEQNPDLNKIYSQEEDILIDFDIIRDKIYEIQV